MAEETINTSENLNNDPTPVDQLLAKSDFLNPASIEQPMAPKINWQDNFINKTNFIKDNTAGISPNYPPSQVAQTRRDGISTGSVEAILEKGISKINGMSDKGSYAEPYAYDAGPKGTFRDKYKAYGQETYNKIGFHPLIDNETWFNQNTTFGDDITKWATNSMWPMLSKGFMDPIRSYKSIIDGDGLFYADEKSARDYAYYNAIGSSTKGGLGGFTVNLLNSASYSLGILAEGATEGALIGALFGGGNPVAGAAEGGTSFLRKLGSLPKALVEASKATKTLLTEVKNYSNISKAKELYTNAGKSFLNFANPLHNTTAAYNQLKNTDNLTNLARSATTAGALWHDIMAMNLGLSEGKLEGGFTRYETYDRLYNEFLLDPKNKGVPPDLAQQESMMRQASKGAWWNTLNNSFLIYYTNKLVFPSITNASFLKGTARMGFGSTVTNVGKEYQILFDPGKKALEGAFVKQRVNFVNAIKSLAKPATYGKVGLNYFKANVFEGIQEVSQDVLQEATQNYYVNTFKNPDARNFRYGTGLLGDAIGKQWSSQGLETFLSGFLMGTILQAPGKIKSYATIGYNDYFKKDASYQKYITGREKLADDVVNELNTMYKSGQFFLDPRINNYANQALVANVIDNPDEHTTKEIRDAEFTAFQSAVISSLQTGTFDMFLKHYEGYKQASPEDIEQAWSLAPGQGVIALERFDKALENAKEISKRWVSAKEKMKFEANLDDYEKDSEEYRIAQVYNKAYSQSLFNYVFLRNSFDDNLSRIDKIYSELGQLTSIQNSNFSNFVNLTDSGRLTQEIEMLKTEVENLESFGSTPALEEASKKRELIELYSSFNEKQEKLVDLFLSKVLGENNIVTGRLNNIKKNIQESDTSLSSDEVTKKAIESLIKDYDEGNTNEFTEYKEAFTSLLFGLADTSAKRLQLEQEIEKMGGIDQIFDSLIDTHVLKNENASLINYVNTLSNPREFYEHLMRNFKFMKDLYNNREEIAKEIVNKEIEAIENNTLLNTLADQGYYIDLDEFAEWIENKTLPEQFIDARNNRIINKGSVLYEELIQIFIRAAKLAAKKPAGDPLNQKQLLDKRIQSLESDRDDAIQREKEKYEEAFKKVYGITPQEYEEQEASRVAEEEISDEERKELEDLKKLFESAVKKLESDNYIEVQAAAEVIADKVFNEGSDKQNAQEFFEEQVQIYMNDPEKKALIIKLKDKYDSEDMDDNVDAALKSQIYGEAVATALSLIEETLNKKSSAPTIDVENNKDYILYQEAVQTINEKYDALVNEVKEDFSKKGVDETTPDEYTTKTDFEDFDAEFQDEITELFDAYLVDVLMENISLKSTNPLDYEKFRTNWLERQSSLINKFNEQSKQKAQERARRLSEPPILKFAPAKIDGTTPTFTISSMIGALNRYLEAGEYPDPADKNKKIQLTPEDIININDDIAALNGYLYARVSMAEPRNIAEETINLIQENVINKEEEIVILYDDEGNMIGRTFKDRGPEDPIPERTTQVAEEIETTLLDKDPFVYNALKDTVNENGEVVASPVENLFNQFFSDPEVQAEDKVRLFMEAFKRKAFQAGKGGWKQFRYQEKLDAVENSLKTVGTLEDLKRTIEKYAFKESSDAGDYVDTLIKIFLTPNAANKSNFSEFTYDSAIEVKGNMKKISDMMSKKVFDKLFAPVTTTNPGGIITKFRLGIIDGTYRILSENVTLFDKSLRNGRGVTGEIDLLLVREDGSVAIVDIKTSTEYKWKDFGKGTDYDKSTYFRAQQSIYGTMFYNNTAITPDLKLMPFSLVLSEDKIGYIEDIDLASIVPEGQDTIELEYLPEIANFGIDKITPDIKAPVRTATTEIRIVESTIKKNAVEFKIKSKKDNTVIREFIVYKKGEIVIIEPIQGSNAKTLDISETEKEDLLKQFISQESLDLIYQHRDSPSDKTIESSLQQSLNKDAASATSRLSRPTDTKADVNLISTPVSKIVEELSKLKTLNEKLDWLKNNNLLSPININGKEYNTIDYSDRVMVLMKVGKYNIPFYISTGQAGKKNVKAGNWYAVFGIGVEKGWINKGSEEQINNNYGFQVFEKLSKILNEGIGVIESREDNGNGKLKEGIGFLSDSKQDLEAFNNNMNLPTKPAGKNTDTKDFYDHVNSTLSLLNNELKELAALGTDTKADVNGIPESDPTLNTLKDNIDKAIIYNGRVGKLVRMPDGNFGVEVTINNDITVLQLTLDALNANLLLEKNQFGSQELIEELEKNITKISNAISSSKGITEVFPLQKDLKNISNGEITLDKAGVQLIVPINSIGELSTIKGKVISVSFSNQEETIASINGVRYDIVRDGSGNITVLSYMSNAEKINAIDNEINERNNKINKLRNTNAVVEQDGSVTWDYRKDSIITRIVDLQDEIKALVGKRTSLFETNKKTYLYGENANDYIFALNRLPNNFQRLTRTATKANETQDLKSISSLSLNRSVADAITVILSEQYPEAMDKLIDGDTKSLDSKDLLNIQLWIEDTVNKLNQLGYSVINRGDLVDDIANQIAVLNEISNNLALIKLTKDGKIKNFKQVAEIFREPGVQKRSSVPKNEGTSRGKTKSSPGPATREELQDLVKKAREENLGDVFGEPAAAKVNSAVVEKIMNAKLSNIEEIYQTEFLKAQANDEDITGLTEAYNTRLEELKTIVSLQNVEVGEYLITKKFIFIGPTKVGNIEIAIVTKIDGDNVTLKNIKTDASRVFTETELVENFEKTTMEATQPEPEVEITQFDAEESTESKNAIDELIKNGQDAIAEAKEKAKASDKKSRWNKLGDNSKLC